MSWDYAAPLRHAGGVDHAITYAARLAADAGRAADHAGSRLLAAYVHGSAALGGWIPGRSDVDILFVAADETTPAIADKMAQAIGAAGAHCPGRDLETSVVAASAARKPGPPWPYLVHVVAGPQSTVRVARPDAASPGDPDLLMHYAVCSAAGLAVFGPPADELIGPIERAAILAYLADELDWGLANAGESYAVLNACRAQAYLADGAIVSKLAGGQTALHRGSGPADVITRALAQQRGEQPDQPPAPDAADFARGVAAQLRSGS
jgi:Domain of unknown function (DUF4111)